MREACMQAGCRAQNFARLMLELPPCTLRPPLNTRHVDSAKAARQPCRAGRRIQGQPRVKPPGARHDGEAAGHNRRGGRQRRGAWDQLLAACGAGTELAHVCCACVRAASCSNVALSHANWLLCMGRRRSCPRCGRRARRLSARWAAAAPSVAASRAARPAAARQAAQPAAARQAALRRARPGGAKAERGAASAAAAVGRRPAQRMLLWMAAGPLKRLRARRARTRPAGAACYVC